MCAAMSLAFRVPRSPTTIDIFVILCYRGGLLSVVAFNVGKPISNVREPEDATDVLQ